MTNKETFSLDPILHPKISNVDVPRLWARRHTTVFLQLYGALIVLLESIFSNLVALGLEEILGPDCAR